MTNVNVNPEVEPIRIVNPNLINACLNLAAPGVDAITEEKRKYNVLEEQLKELEKFVYRPKSIRGALRSLVKDTIILEKKRWSEIVSKKEDLKEEMEYIEAVLQAIQHRMDYLLVNLPAE
ncbi:uncharacterized protein H6S33_006540 [Morchella sextelata]|uniref:uncharacterized protein n=1 Tax=Morchella sextelata TaxID=1174677 RepID=UPI001D048DB9|nr:uncharacterized protein H6S33_006540 [Morchella sextelata]KAH0604872.1 hypothetical protein H6S33_006540 [Morchella sextelata]